MMRVPKINSEKRPLSGGVITSEQIAKLDGISSSKQKLSKNKQADPDALYTPSDWESDAYSGTGTASEAETDDEEEEKARRAFIEALKSAPGPAIQSEGKGDDIVKPTLAAEVKSEKSRREQMLRDLEREAEEARTLAEQSAAPELGRLYNDAEGGVMTEEERNLDAAMAAPDALQVLAELNKKKELKSVDHSKIDYIDFKKNIYIVPKAHAGLSSDDVADLRAKLKVKVRGKAVPAPVSSFEQCGLSERILRVLEKQGITKPFPVQAQCIPCIMAGRDTIGIAKTGSGKCFLLTFFAFFVHMTMLLATSHFLLFFFTTGKTLSYLLPLLRHIMVQPSLEPNESGPIGLILAPARELAYQIHLVCKSFAKSLGLK
jgi:ATP-dependent RNA helicase DDX46/PRP5